MPKDQQTESRPVTVATLIESLQDKMDDPITVGFGGPHGEFYNVPIKAVRFSFSAALPPDQQRRIILDVGQVTPFVVIQNSDSPDTASIDTTA